MVCWVMKNQQQQPQQHCEISVCVRLSVSLRFTSECILKRCAGNYHYNVITRMQSDVGDILQRFNDIFVSSVAFFHVLFLLFFSLKCFCSFLPPSLSKNSHPLSLSLYTRSRCSYKNKSLEILCTKMHNRISLFQSKNQINLLVVVAHH